MEHMAAGASVPVTSFLSPSHPPDPFTLRDDTVPLRCTGTLLVFLGQVGAASEGWTLLWVR